MADSIDDITINYEEDGVIVTKELDKNILTRGAWTTILFRYQVWNKTKQTYWADVYTIRRYQKRNNQYMPRSKFNISSAEQARKIIATLNQWLPEEEEGKEENK